MEATFGVVVVVLAIVEAKDVPCFCNFRKTGV
jgi:hypothetical protein